MPIQIDGHVRPRTTRPVAGQPTRSLAKTTLLVITCPHTTFGFDQAKPGATHTSKTATIATVDSKVNGSLATFRTSFFPWRRRARTADDDMGASERNSYYSH